MYYNVVVVVYWRLINPLARRFEGNPTLAL
jgi:hypothetical protein